MKDKKMIYAFDIDGTICTHEYGDYEKSKPYYNVIEKINELYFSDKYIILFFTARGTNSGRDLYEFTKNQLESWDVKFHKLILGKPYFDLLIDDRAISNKEWYKQNKIKVSE